jgi:hypothetical protein
VNSARGNNASTKNLSVNKYRLSPADQGGSQGEKTAVAPIGFFQAHQDLAKAVELGVSAFHTQRRAGCRRLGPISCRHCRMWGDDLIEFRLAPTGDDDLVSELMEPFRKAEPNP